MKKTVMRLSTALSLILLAGCGSSSSSSSPSDIGLKALSQNSIEVKEDTKEEVSVTLQTLDKKSSIQEGVNFTIVKGVKKGEIIGKVKSDKFDGEIINMWLCGECSYLFSIDEAGNLVANCDIDEDFDGATMTLKATVKKDGSCCEVEDEIVVSVDENIPVSTESISLATSYMVLDENSINILDTLNTNGHPRQIVISSDGSKLYVVDGYESKEGIKIIDITDPKKQILIGSSSIYGYTSLITLSKDETNAYIISSDDTEYFMTIVDITDPKKPKYISSSDANYDGNGNVIKSIALSKDETNAYVIDIYGNIMDIDITDPKKPKKPKLLNKDNKNIFINFTDSKKAKSKDGTKVFIVDHKEKGIKVLDVTDPKKPNLLGTLDIDVFPQSIVLSKDETKVYVSDRKKGIITIDLISNIVNKTKDFKDSSIGFSFMKFIDGAEVSIIADRNDIITIGEYSKTLTANSEDAKSYSIPISSVSGATGVTTLTIKVTKDGKVGTRKVIVKVI